jgi:integrase/recombinase XerD
MGSAGDIGLFLDMLAVERNASRNTLDAYRRDLTDFADDLSGDLNAATTDDVRAYLGRLEAHGAKASTAARRLSALKQYFQFLYAEGMRGDDPCEPLRGPKKPKPLPKVMNEDAVDRLLNEAKRVCEQTDLTPSKRLKALRMRALLELLYATGLRVSELVSLPRSVASGGEAFVVRGKGGRERLVPLTPIARTAMTAYLEALDADKRRARSAFPLSSRQRGGSSDAPGFCARSEGAWSSRGPFTQAAIAACLATRICQPFARPWRRFAHGSVIAGP